MIYADTGVLVKLYYPEPESAAVQDFFVQTAGPILLSILHRIELENALQRKIFVKDIRAAQAKAILADVQDDFDAGVLLAQYLDLEDVMSRALHLSRRTTGRFGCRTMDLLHVAAALQIGAGEFLSFDERQTKAAKYAGLKCIGRAQLIR